MNQRIAHLAVVVADYDEALRFYTEQLGFRLVEDTALGDGQRWVLVAPPGATECSVLLAQAATETQRARVGDQTGGRVFLFLFTDDFGRDYQRLLAAGVRFVRPPRQEPYGRVAVFEDLYGNQWDLLEPSERNHGRLGA